MTRTILIFAAVAGAAAAAATAVVLAQDVPAPLMACIADGTKVRHTYITHADPAKLKEAVRIYETRMQDADYPEGTIIRMIPQEAMVKRAKSAFPNTNGWEYFALGVTPEGTTVRARGDEAGNRLGTCKSCHAGASRSDAVCGGGPGCTAVPLTEDQIALLQGNDPRCKKS
jgi:hypothetical protein